MKRGVAFKFRQIIAIAPVWLGRKLSNKQFLMVAAVLVGLWAGLTAVVLKISVHYLQQTLVVLGRNHSWIYFLSPAVGILIAFLFVKFVLKGEFMKGTSHVLLAIAKKSSFLPRRDVFSQAVTSAFTVGLGGSAGLESPIVQTGSAIGSMFASWFPLNFRDRTLLLACGAAAGIATAFNAPIAGVLFALEVLLVDVSISAFIPLLIAGATGALCSKIILADGILLSFKQVSDFNYHNVPYYIVLGVLCGLVSILYQRTFFKADHFFKTKLHSSLARYIVGVVLLGGLIVLFPVLFGEGYGSIVAMANFDPGRLFEGSPLSPLLADSKLLLGLAILTVGLVKVFAVSFTLNAGGNGGNFAPSLLVGACIGFSFSFLVNLGGVGTLPVSNFILVAMAGLLTGIFHAPLTAIFLIAEITGGYDLMIPLMIVSALSTAVSRYANPRSLDQVKLAQSHSTSVISKDTHVLSELSVRSFIEKDFSKIQMGATLGTLVNTIASSKRNIFPVIDNQERLAGIVVLENIREIMFNASLYETVTVDQLMQKPIAIVEVNEDMSTIMEKFDKTGVWNIPVVEKGRYLGFVSKSRIFSNYRDKLKEN